MKSIKIVAPKSYHNNLCDSQKTLKMSVRIHSDEELKRL